MKTLLAIVLVSMLVFAGCTGPSSAAAPPAGGTASGAQSGGAANGAPAAGNGAAGGAVAAGGETSPVSSGNDANGGTTASSAPKFTKPYVITTLILQYGDKDRIEKWLSRTDYLRYDNLTAASGIEVNVARMPDSPGFTQPLADPSKTIITLRAEDGTTYRLQPADPSGAAFAALPTVFWMLNPAVYPDTSTSQFLLLQPTKLLAPGTYNLSVDVEGNGTVFSKLLVVPGVSISNPAYASKQPVGGFNVDWTQAGLPGNYIYRATVGGKGIGYGYLANDENLTQTSLSVTPSKMNDNSNTIEPGIYLLNFQMEGGQYETVVGKELLDYYQTGSSPQPVIFGTINVKEVRFVKFKVGDFCHCDDTFLAAACTSDERQADPLCN